MSGIQITGPCPEQPIEGVRLENIRLTFQGRRERSKAATRAAGTRHRLSRTPELRDGRLDDLHPELLRLNEFGTGCSTAGRNKIGFLAGTAAVHRQSA
jgi:hypothetical protein